MSIHLFISRLADLNDLDFGGGLHGQFVPAGARTDRELDAYQHMLLWHESEHNNLAGLASVVYWGFATRNEAFAQWSVNRLMQGYRVQPAVAVTPAVAAAHCLRAARNAVAQGQYGEALGHMGSLYQLGRTPFASKVIAFIDPDNAGVYDNKINNGLVSHPILANHIVPGGLFERCTDGIGAVNQLDIQRRYHAWCKALCRIAAHINGRLQVLPLRALDIERAIFAAIRRAG
jgi:hypothetical protein